MRICPTCGEENADRARFCQNCATPLTDGERPSEVRKVVTIVFADVTGSTALGERLDPEAMRRVMGRYFDEMSAVIERHGGTVEKFIGDAVMAVFGIPQLHEDDALRAVRAADGMRAALGDAEPRPRTRPRRRSHRADRCEHRRGRRRRPERRSASGDRRRGERRRPARTGGGPGRDPAGREHASAREGRRRGHAGRAARPEGQGRAGPRVPARRGAGGHGRTRPAPGLGDGRAAQGARDARARARSRGHRADVAPVHAPGTRRRGEVPAGLGVRRGTGDRGHGPARQVPVLRRGHHVLPALRDRAGGRGCRTHRRPRDRSVQARDPRRGRRGPRSHRLARRRHALVGRAGRGRGRSVGRPQAPRAPRPRAAARVRVRRHPLGGAQLPRAGRAPRGLDA